MLSLGIKYSMRDILRVVHYCAWGAKLDMRYTVYTISAILVSLLHHL